MGATIQVIDVSVMRDTLSIIEPQNQDLPRLQSIHGNLADRAIAL